MRHACVVFIALALPLAAWAADDTDTGVRPAPAWADEYPMGCIDCHTADHGNRLDRLLGEIGHPEEGLDIELVPGGCAECHAPDDEGIAYPLGPLVHQLHFDMPETNGFIEEYAGDCRVCHVMDGVTGEPSAKGGPRNW